MSELSERVDAIIALAEAEGAAAGHIAEDELMRDMIRVYAPDEVNAEIDRLDAAPFSRWYA